MSALNNSAGPASMKVSSSRGRGRIMATWCSLRRLGKDRGGGALIEFAAAIPVLALLLLGGVEFARFAIANQKMDRVSSLVGDYVSQANVMNAATMNDFFVAAQELAAPFDFAGNGTVIVSTVSQSGGPPEVLWQQTGGGGLAATSSVGSAGGPATLPPAFPMDDNESVVVAEVYFNYDPLFMPALVPNPQVYFRSFYRPRRTAVLEFN